MSYYDYNWVEQIVLTILMLWMWYECDFVPDSWLNNKWCKFWIYFTFAAAGVDSIWRIYQTGIGTMLSSGSLPATWTVIWIPIGFAFTLKIIGLFYKEKEYHW